MLACSLAGGAVFAADKIDLNAASAEELQLIDGIGPATAAKIVAYREANGDFTNIDDLTNVKGIGEKKAASVMDQVTIGE
nr:ComEA family DNA-binding protein [Methylophaga frappieri]